MAGDLSRECKGLVDGVDDRSQLDLILENARRKLDRDRGSLGARFAEGDVALFVAGDFFLSGS